MDVTFFYKKILRFFDKDTECRLDLRDVIRIRRVPKALQALPPNQKISYVFIDSSKNVLDVLRVIKCLRGSQDTHEFTKLGNVTSFCFSY